jgi:hypothetical protein
LHLPADGAKRKTSVVKIQLAEMMMEMRVLDAFPAIIRNHIKAIQKEWQLSYMQKQIQKRHRFCVKFYIFNLAPEMIT